MSNIYPSDPNYLPLKIYGVGFLGAVCIFFASYGIRLTASLAVSFWGKDAHDPVIQVVGLLVLSVFFAVMVVVARIFFRRNSFLKSVPENYHTFFSWFVAFFVWFFIITLGLFELGLNISEFPRNLFILHIWISLISLFLVKLTLKRLFKKSLS